MPKEELFLGKDKQSINDLIGFAEDISVTVLRESRFGHFQQTYKNDRIAFVYDCMPAYGKSIASYQLEILGYFDEGKSRVSVRGPHGLGKTFLASIMVHHSVLTAEDDCKVPTTASAWQQLEKYLWPEIKKAAANLAWHVIGRDKYSPRTELLTQAIRLNGGLVEAFAISSEDHNRMEGAHARRMVYVIDEAKIVPAPMWDAIEGAFSTEGLALPSDIVEHIATLGDDSHTEADYKPVTSEWEAMAFAISTPGPPTGRFYDIHTRKPGYEDWTVRHVTIDEAIRAGRVSSQWVDNRRRQWGEDSEVFRNRVLGEFADNTEDGVIPLSWLEDAIRRWNALKEQGRIGDSVGGTIGVDVARYGQDQTVFAVVSGPILHKLHTHSKLSSTEVASKLRPLIRRTGARTNIEVDGGYGAGVYDALTDRNFEENKSITGVSPIMVKGSTNFRDRSDTLSFLNVRAAMWWNLRELLNPEYGSDLALPPDEYLKQDLMTPQWDYTDKGVVKLESKKNIMLRLGRSPDYGTACCLAYWNASMGGGMVF